MKKGISLNLKLIFAISLAVIVLASAWMIIMISFMNYLTDSILQETMLPLARTAALSVEANLHDLADRIILIRDNIAVISSVSETSERQQMLETAASGVEFIWLGFFNPDGSLVNGTYKSPPDIRNSIFFPMMKQTNNVVVDDIHVGSSGQLEIVIGAPVKVTEGDPYYLVGSYKYDLINDVLGNINVSAGSTAYIVNMDGKFMAHRQQDLVRFEYSIFNLDRPGFSVNDIFSKVNRGEIGSMKLGAGSAQRFFSFAPIRGTRWALIIEVPRIDYMSRMQQGIFISILSTVILLVGFTFIFSFSVHRIIINPLKIITDSTRQLNRGVFGHELSEKMIQRTDEIGMLANAFVSMSGAIEKVLDEIDRMTYAAATGRLGQRLHLSSHEG
ncbi:MAG: HAMP domain-containing protein, partial [Treponema sp.]|nr:HAMP domain-containing protein [Treponema sp.]